LRSIQDRVETIAVERPVRQYLVDVGAATRRHPQVALGMSPRGLLIWQRLAQAWAYLKHRGFVTPDDALAVAEPMLDVRLGIDAEASASVISQIIDSVSAPAIEA
jgi:MoxR-like ATPase